MRVPNPLDAIGGVRELAAKLERKLTNDMCPAGDRTEARRKEQLVEAIPEFSAREL